jgi:dihydrodipicolinate synthase/N-acetylneuraminate lyase
MQGTGVPVATPFGPDGAVDHEALRSLVDWLESGGIDFLVPCGSTSEAPLLDDGERAAVVETVVDAASVPVLAGTGRPGLRPTLAATERAADAGADAALVVTPYYYSHDRDTLATYYRDLADESPLPVYLYSVPSFTGVRLTPGTVADLADHPNVAGLKDSTGNLTALTRTRARTPPSFDLLVGAGGVYAGGLDAGADGGVLALANVVPEYASAVFDRHADDPAGARALNHALVDLNHTVTAGHGVPGLKAAMRARGAPAGHPRSPHQPLSTADRDHVQERLEQALDDAESV